MATLDLVQTTENIQFGINTRPKSEQKLSVLSVLCRICYDNDKDEPLIAPCHCKGSVAFVHCSCLERWLAESNSTTCELCHQIFQTERTPKYTSKQAIWKWLRYHPIPGETGRGIRGDLIACTLITPLAIIITYVCLFSSDYYNQKKFAAVPAAKWTSVSLLAMISIMLVGYYLWVFSVIRLHSHMWYNWWQRECIVKYIPPKIFNFSNEQEHVDVPANTPNSVISANDDSIESNLEGVESFVSKKMIEVDVLHHSNQVTINILDDDDDENIHKETTV